MIPSRKPIWESKGEARMKPYIITIARQYGSGGKTVGKMLANKLDIPY